MVILLLLLVCGVLLGTSLSVEIDEIKRIFISVIPVLFSPIVAVYPVVLGYNNQICPNRCRMILDFSIVFSIGSLFCILGLFIYMYIEKYQYTLAILLIMTSMCIFLDDYSSFDMVTRNMNRQLKSGEYENYYTETRELYEYLEKSTGDVIVSHDLIPTGIDNYHILELFDKKESVENVAMATFFKCDSVSISE